MEIIFFKTNFEEEFKAFEGQDASISDTDEYGDLKAKR